MTYEDSSDDEFFDAVDTPLATSSASSTDQLCFNQGASYAAGPGNDLANGHAFPVQERFGGSYVPDNPGVVSTVPTSMVYNTRDSQQQTDLAVPPPADTSNVSYEAHRAVFVGDLPLLVELIELECFNPRTDPPELDPQGNSVLHVAVLRKDLEAAKCLLDAGFPVNARNASGWSACDEAISLEDAEMTKLLHTTGVAEMKREMKEKKALLLATMRDMPSYGFKLRWELTSALLGMLLKRYGPHDTYEVWKHGTRIRVDGTLMGIEDESKSLIPEWKRGHFSLLFDGAPQPATIQIADHGKRTVIDLQKEHKKAKPDIDEEVAELLEDGAGKSKMKSSELRFKPAKTWLGGNVTEKVEGWNTRVYDAVGKLVAITRYREPWLIPPDASWEDYLAMMPPQDEELEVAIDPLSGGSSKPDKPEKEAELADTSKSQGDDKKEKKKAKSARKVSGRCWMAEDFPMSLSQLLPVLDVIGHANKHLARISKFLTKYGGLRLFPIKLQIPLIMTVNLLISFRKFHVLQPGDPGLDPAFYEVPSSYRRITLAEAKSKMHSQVSHKHHGSF